MRPRPAPLHAATVLAMSLTSGAALAQSSVNVSGYLSLGYLKKTGGPHQIGTIERSNLAFSGSEDLGGGLSATFKLSHRFDMDTGTVEASDNIRPFWKGESTVGLKGGFGAIRLGRALTPLWAQTWNADPRYGFDRIASQQWWSLAPDYLSDPMNGQGPGGGLGADYPRLNNGIFYGPTGQGHRTRRPSARRWRSPRATARARAPFAPAGARTSRARRAISTTSAARSRMPAPAIPGRARC
jgi:hypothetical protein